MATAFLRTGAAAALAAAILIDIRLTKRGDTEAQFSHGHAQSTRPGAAGTDRSADFEFV